MATSAHCAYCFECLSASLERRKPLTLAQTEDLWVHYETDLKGHEETETDAGTEGTGQQNGGLTQGLRQSAVPAAIGRLLAPSSLSDSSNSLQSSGSSTPSTTTDASSAASKSSSRTSIQTSSSSKSYASASSKKTGSEVACPLFVTWNMTGRSGHKNLRGCIGTFEPHDLDDGLRSYALTSAFEDHRFKPISAREVPSLECAVTLLTDFEPIDDPMDWEIGKHGLRISFNWQGRRYGSTYLPDVAREQQWTKEETMVSLMRKGGWEGSKNDWRNVKGLKVIRYQGKKESLDYHEWQQWKMWLEETGGRS